MVRSQFSVFKHQTGTDKNGKPVVKFYARFHDDDGKVIKTRVLKATTATKAALEAKSLCDSGAGADDDPFVVDMVRAAWTQGSIFLRLARHRERHRLRRH